MRFTCDETGYTYGPERQAHRDLSAFTIDTVSYHTAACYWWEIHRLGGLPAIRGVLASMRRNRPTSAGQIVEHANLVVNADLRPYSPASALRRRAHRLAALTRRGWPCTLIGTESNDTFAGTIGVD